MNMTPEQSKQIEKLPCIKNYVVFNSEFIENIQELNLNIVIDDLPQENNIHEIENCENFISKIIVNGNLDLKFNKSAVAYYSPSNDFVSMPERQYFVSTSKYYSVLFHEIIHWTGHTDRLNRDLKGSQDQESYSFEELIAEMGAMLNCLQFGILEEFINSVRYLKSWSDINSHDRETAIRKAFTDSKKAKKFLENL
jgi:antirestriction protein ArdC